MPGVPEPAVAAARRTAGLLVIGADGLIESAAAEAAAQLPRLYARGLPSDTMLIADGAPTRQIATALAISEHTVRDYVKAVFDKVGVSSRVGLIAELFGDRYQRSVLGTDRISTA
jgi:Bacterial regulatory proteins, luxR family